ncbi:MAG: OmpA family protein [Nitrospiraceae bacterium]|jgi:chemotaxis protein MotB|nr:OmpA family protein [Nitrospiraceae bacterium]
MMRIRRRRKDSDHPENLDRWLISYADFMTLMFTFFVALYALSSMDHTKLEKFSLSLRQVFKVIDDPIKLHYTKTEKSIAEELKAVLKNEDNIAVNNEQRGIVITFSDTALFTSGSADVRPEADGVLSRIADKLKTTPGRVFIEGHTDNVPISSGRFHSNWELSAARASSVLHALVGKGLDPHRFTISGYGEYRPLSSNETPEGRAQNRRVELVVMPPDQAVP